MDYAKTQFLIEVDSFGGPMVRTFKRRRETVCLAAGPYHMKPIGSVPWKEMSREQQAALQLRTVWTLVEVP